jgi:hypothetical protein
MGAYGGPNIVTNGLVLHLDAGVNRSYPGSGSTWYDLSTGNRNYSFGANISWNSAGYFDCSGGVFTGPASNTFGFSSTSECYIEAYVQATSATTNTFFDWRATPSLGSDTRAIFSHLYYSNGNTYFDVNGCCDVTQRIQYANDSDLTAGIRHFSYRVRTNTTPYRQMFKNTVEQVSSGANSTATSTWNLTTAATIASGWSGKLYVFRVYNRSLTDAEILNNYNATKKRFNL